MGCARRARGQRSSTPTCARGALVFTSVDAREKLRGLRVRCHLSGVVAIIRHNSQRAATRAFHAPRLARAHRPDARRLALLCPPHPPSAPPARRGLRSTCPRRPFGTPRRMACRTASARRSTPATASSSPPRHTRSPCACARNPSRWRTAGRTFSGSTSGSPARAAARCASSSKTRVTHLTPTGGATTRRSRPRTGSTGAGSRPRRTSTAS